MLKTICPIFLEDSDAFKDDFAILNEGVCDLIEMRLDDYYDRQGKAKLLEKVEEFKDSKDGKDIIWTLRTKEQGGKADVLNSDYAEVIEKLYELPGLVDVELDRIKAVPDADRSRMVLSWHDFNATPSQAELGELWDEMEAIGPKIEKISVMPNSPADVQALLRSCIQHPTDKEKIAISMGEMGKISRILADFYGSGYTFASHITSSAPGQPSLEELAFYRSAITQK